MEEVSTFLSTLSEEKLLPSARCVSPTRYCGPCTNQINLFYYEDCEVFHENMCFEWLRGWSHLVRFMEADIKAIKNIQSEYYIYRVFESKFQSKILYEVIKVLWPRFMTKRLYREIYRKYTTSSKMKK